MEKLPFFGYSLYEMAHYFLIWSFIGWVIEIVDMTFETGEYQNRGMLNMPICPIYGVGVLLIIAILRPLKGTFLALCIGSSIICTAIELGVGLLLEAIFHNRWWDYSHMHFNYKGLICLRNSVLWGVGCVIMMNVVQPMLEKWVGFLDIRIGFAIILIMAVLIVIDIAASLKAIKNLNDRLKQLDAISGKMLAFAQKIGGVLADKTQDVMELNDRIKQKIAEIKVNREEYEEEFSQIESEYHKIIDQKSIADRLIKAFPTISNPKYSSVLHALKRKINPESTEHFELRLDEVKRYNERHSKRKNTSGQNSTDK